MFSEIICNKKTPGSIDSRFYLYFKNIGYNKLIIIFVYINFKPLAGASLASLSSLLVSRIRPLPNYLQSPESTTYYLLPNNLLLPTYFFANSTTSTIRVISFKCEYSFIALSLAFDAISFAFCGCFSIQSTCWQ